MATRIALPAKAIAVTPPGVRAACVERPGDRLRTDQAFKTSDGRPQQPQSHRSGTVDGLLLVGIGEAVLLGIAYKLTGVPHPVLLGLATGIMSVVPFASPLVFIAAGLWLLAQSAIIAAIVLVAFGSVVVFVADHFVRPALIGGSTRLPFVWVLLGILGGVETFGLLGLLLGPALLAVLIALWREIAAPPAATQESTGSQTRP